MVEPIEDPTDEDLARFRRTLAPRDFNHTWELLDKDRLSREEEEEMLASAFSQRHNWYQVGTPKNWAVADWQIARVAAILGHVDLARRFGERSLELAVEHDLGPFVTGFAHEAIARAAASVDDVDTFSEHLELAKATLPEIADDEDRELLESDLAEMSEL